MWPIGKKFASYVGTRLLSTPLLSARMALDWPPHPAITRSAFGTPFHRPSSGVAVKTVQRRLNRARLLLAQQLAALSTLQALSTRAGGKVIAEDY